MGNKPKNVIRSKFFIRGVMIGQSNLLNTIDKSLERFPRFSIIIGPSGSGKKTLCNLIAQKLKLKPVYFGVKIDDIRKAIDMAYTQYEPLVIIIPDADKMSVAAKNSLLKVTEEPPKNCYFIITLQSKENTLPTILSRGTVFTLDTYSEDELVEYSKLRGYSQEYSHIIRTSCSNTGEVDALFKQNISEFYTFASQITKYINVPKNGNTFKITKRMKLKDTDEEGFDTILLLKTIQKMFLEKGITDKAKPYLEASIETNKTIQQLNLNNVSKLGLIDMWIMNVRKILN